MATIGARISEKILSSPMRNFFLQMTPELNVACHAYHTNDNLHCQEKGDNGNTQVATQLAPIHRGSCAKFRKKMRVTCLLTVMFCLTPSVFAQSNDVWNPEWDRFRLTPYDQEVIDGIKEVQDLMRGRESIIQGYLAQKADWGQKPQVVAIYLC
jgi:hypothetical protein